MLAKIALATLLTLSCAAFAACSDEPDVIQPKPGGSGGNGGGGGSSGSHAGASGAGGGKAGSGAAGTTEQDAGPENDAG